MSKDKHEEFESVENISSELDTINEFIVNYWKHFIYGGLLAILLLGVAMALLQSSNEASVKAAAELEQAQTIPELQKAIAAHPAYGAADFARLRLGTLLFADKKYDEAKAMFDKIGVASPLPFWMGKLNDAYSVEAKGDSAAAAEKFKAIGDDITAPPPLRCQANYEAGRIYLAKGDKEKGISRLNLCAGDKQKKWELWSDLAEKTLERLN